MNIGNIRPKLHGTVTFVPTPEGILFRAGDRFLPVRGREVWTWFDRFRPFLDGRSSIDSLCESAGTQTRDFIVQILDALMKAEMLYDAPPDAFDAPPEIPQNRFSPLIARIESRSTQPSKVFERARQTRLLVVGNGDMGLAVIESGLEAGLTHQVWCPLEWSPARQGVLDAALDFHRTDGFHPSVQCMDYRDFVRLPDWSSEFDQVVAVANANSDRGWLQAFVDSNRGLGARVIPLLAWGSSVVVGTPAQDGTGCMGCLSQCYMRTECCASKIPRSTLEAGIAIGSRLLVQRLLDFQVGVIPAEEQVILHELNLETMEVCRRPLVSNTACVHCGKENGFSDDGRWPLVDRRTTDVEIKTFLERTEACLVDPKTGIIARLEEGDLLQFPYHQSAALRPVQGRTPTATWFTDAGPDVLLARIEVIRRVLEHHLLEGLASLAPHAEVEVFRSPYTRAENCPAARLLPGVVVSAVNLDELVPQAFFRASARHAHDLEGWMDAPVPVKLIDSHAGLILGYFEDTGILRDIRVQRHSLLSVGGCELLRFFYREKCISVIAGPAGPSVWETGLRDAWLCVTAQESFGDGSLNAPIRFRCPELPREELVVAMGSLTSLAALSLRLVPLPRPETRFVEPFSFSYAFISGGLD